MVRMLDLIYEGGLYKPFSWGEYVLINVSARREIY